MIYNIKKVHRMDVEKILAEELKLNDYQINRMKEWDVIYSLPFDFYEPAQNESVSFLWRLSILFYYIVIFLVIISLPFRFMFVGKWGYNFDGKMNFLNVWRRKLGL